MRDDLRADIRRGMAVGLLLLVCIVPGALLTACHRGTPEPPVLPSPLALTPKLTPQPVFRDTAPSPTALPAAARSPLAASQVPTPTPSPRPPVATSEPSPSPPIATPIPPPASPTVTPVPPPSPPAAMPQPSPLPTATLAPPPVAVLTGRPFRSGPSSTTAWCGPTGGR